MKICAKRENVCANISAQNVLKADISSKQSFDILFGQPAQIDVKAAVKYIKSGQKEIDDYVQTSLESAISSKQDVIEDLENIRTGANLGISAVQPADLDISLSQKQETLVSGTNIKTINNQSLLGSGNIDIQGVSGVDSVNGKTGTVVLSTSDLTNDSGYITTSALAPYALSSSLASVALSGDYDDLTNKPDLSLKADIDLSNITPTAEAQQDITSWAMPDYDSAIALSVTTYTAPSNGWLYCDMEIYEGVIDVKINGKECARGGGNRSNNDRHMVPIKKGQTATINVANRIITFFPCIGG